MELENEKKHEESQVEKQTESREGYQQSGQSSYYPNYRSAGRTPRPRIHAQRAYNSERPAYNRQNREEGGFRPEGFGAALQQNNPQRPQYRPRFNNNGYGQQRPQYRSNYNNTPATEGEGEETMTRNQQYNGYQQRGGYQQRRGGYGQQRGLHQRRGGYDHNAG